MAQPIQTCLLFADPRVCALAFLKVETGGMLSVARVTNICRCLTHLHELVEIDTTRNAAAVSTDLCGTTIVLATFACPFLGTTTSSLSLSLCVGLRCWECELLWRSWQGLLPWLHQR